jgi:undecaprenyl-diphosphatase
MIELLKNIDKDIFVFLNSQNSGFIDPIMKEISAHWFWIPVIITFFWFLYKDYGKKIWLPILAFALCFVLTDQGSSFFKDLVQRFRPTHNLALQDIVHTVDGYRGGLYGFFSGHAANSFGLFVLSSLILKRKTYTYIVLFWAVIVTYSRIYLGVHYPSDIIAGIIWGCSCGYLCYKVMYMLDLKYISK